MKLVTHSGIIMHKGPTGFDCVYDSPKGQAEWNLFKDQTNINANYDVVAEAEAILAEASLATV
jgi:hypothetical protein